MLALTIPVAFVHTARRASLVFADMPFVSSTVGIVGGLAYAVSRGIRVTMIKENGLIARLDVIIEPNQTLALVRRRAEVAVGSCIPVALGARGNDEHH